MPYLAYLIATILVPLLPERLGYWLFARIGDLAFLFGRGLRAAYFNNLAHVLGPDANPAAKRRIAHGAFQNLAKNYFDLFRGHQLNEKQLRAQLAQVTGFEHIETALARGQGVVLGSAHLGNFNMLLHLAAVYLKEERDIVVPIERLKPEPLYELVKRQREAQGIDIVPADTAARALLKALRAGNLIGLALDFDATHTGPVVTFFGAPAQLPDGAVALSIKFKAPFVIGYIRRLENNRCVAVIEPPIEFETTGDFAQDILCGVERVARRLEDWISHYPEQWLMFQPIWEQDRVR